MNRPHFVSHQRPFTISGDELELTVPTTSQGSGHALDVWKRAK